jgi:hypothetical protein
MDREILQENGDLERWFGRREAFAIVAGRCSAAQAESMRRVRDSKVYREKGWTWEECCVKGFGSSRRNVERTLRLLDEFGPAYFHVAQMTHVTADEYRAIAPHISQNGVRFEGEVVALLPENSEQVSAAVAGLLHRERPVKAAAPLSFDGVVKRCEALMESVEQLGELEPLQAMKLGTSISRLRLAAVKKGVAA